MQNLIDKYGLFVKEGPLYVHHTHRFSLDQNIKDSKFFFQSANPEGSYDKMFPVPNEILGSMNLFLLGYSREIDTFSFVNDVAADPDLRLVGVHEMILFAETHYVHVPEEETIVAPAYQFQRNGCQLQSEKEAQIPYFFLGNHEKIAVKYSRSDASQLSHPGKEYILIGQMIAK